MQPPLAADDLLCQVDGGCRRDAGLGLLQLSRQPQVQAQEAKAEAKAEVQLQHDEPMPILSKLLQTGHIEEPLEGDCEKYPTLCAEPFNCFSEPIGAKDILKMSLGRVATDDGHANLKAWCTGLEWDSSIAKYCIQTPDLVKNAHLVFDKQVKAGVGELDGSYCFLEGHCVNEAVTPDTTLAEAEALCDEKYGHEEWTSLSMLKMPIDLSSSKADGFKSRSWTSYFGKLACAMGNYHCDVIYCRETYCKMDHYKSKYEHFLKENGWA